MKSFEIIVFDTGCRELQTKLLHVQGCWGYKQNDWDVPNDYQKS